MLRSGVPAPPLSSSEKDIRDVAEDECGFVRVAVLPCLRLRGRMLAAAVDDVGLASVGRRRAEKDDDDDVVVLKRWSSAMVGLMGQEPPLVW